MQSDGDPVLAVLDRVERKLDEVLDRAVEPNYRELADWIVAQVRVETGGSPALAAGPGDEPPLSAREAARRLGRKRRWVYDNQDALGVVHQGRYLAFPAGRIDEVLTRGLSVAPGQPDVMPTPRYLRDRHTRRHDAA